MKVITNKDVQEMNRLYLELKTYAAVARKTGFSPATVKKYIIPDFKIVDEANIVRFDRPLPDFAPEMFRTDDWGPLCVLTAEEVEEVKALWNELEV